VKVYVKVKVQLRSFLTSTVDRGEWPASSSDRLTPRKRTLCTRWPAGRVCRRHGLLKALKDLTLCSGLESVLGPTQPSIQWVWRDLFLGVKPPRREGEHSPSTAETKNNWSCISTLYVFMACTRKYLLHHSFHIFFLLILDGIYCNGTSKDQLTN
jgi:hypothetical protein